jgi:MFS family permease
MSIVTWIDRNILSLGREMRLSYLPPLMVYVAAGISGLTGIVGTFVVKEYLGLSAQFLAALAFWAGIPWALKMPLGHLVDLLWRYKSGFVYLGASLIAASLLVMFLLVAHTETMRAVMPLESWYVIAALLAPIGYLLQDVVADAMTVEAVPRIDAAGKPVSESDRKLMNTTMQTLGRVAIIGGGLLVSILNVYLLRDMQAMPQDAKAAVYARIYALALVIPVVSIAGVVLQGFLKRREADRLIALRVGDAEVMRALHGQTELTQPNWWILGGSIGFVAFSLTVGLSRVAHAEEIVFAGSMAIVLFLMGRITRELDDDARRTLIGTALVIFVFRATPLPGEGVSWFMIDELKFDQQFFAVLSLLSSALTLAGLFIFRRFIAEHSIAYVVGALTVAGTLLSLPMIGLYYGIHEWTMAHTAGVVDARFIAIVNTALQSPLGQIAMIPMLVWIAHSAPSAMKATYFAVMASFTNLALSAAELATKYLNGVFTVTREVKDATTGVVKVPADYSELGALLVIVTVIGFAAPMAAILLLRVARLRSA